MKPGAFLALWNDLERGREAEYDRWHTIEHVPERVSAPGFISGCRYVAPQHEVHRWFTFYEVETLEAFHSAEYRDLLQNPTPWSASMRPSFRSFLRAPCERIARVGHGRGAALAVIRFAAADDPVTLLPRFAEGDGIVAATLGRHIEGTPGPAWRGPAPIAGGIAPFDTVALIEALSRSAAERAFAAALAAIGLEREEGDHGGVYDLATVFPGADPEERRAHRRPGWAA